MEVSGTAQSMGGEWRRRVGQCHAAGDIAGALLIVRQALAQAPDDAVARHTLGVLLLAAGRADEAVGLFRALLDSDASADRHFDLAVALEAVGQASAAHAAYTQALGLAPEHFAARLNLCALLLAQGQPEAATDAARILVDRHPRVPEAWCSLAHAQLATLDALAADRAFVAALALVPDHPPAAFGRVLSLAMGGEIAAAETLLAQLNTRFPDAAAVSAIAQAGQMLGLRREDLEDIFLTALFERCRRGEWECQAPLQSGLRRLAEDVRNNAARPVRAIQAFHALAIGAAYDDYRVLARRAALFPVVGDAIVRRPTSSRGSPQRRLKLGFLSPVFRAHPSGFLVRNTFRHHDRARFSVHGYCIGVDDGSAVRQDIVRGCDTFVSLAGLDDRQAAQRIHDDGIDILILFEGFFDGARYGVLAYRPAPLQVAHIGVLGALEAAFIDYRFCEMATEPADGGLAVCEKRVRFHDLYMPHGTPRAPWSMAPSRRDFGLPDAAFVFCSFNNDYKVGEASFMAWIEILRAVPDSILWLRAANEPLWRRCVACAERYGIAPERLVRAADCPNDEHLARLRLADLMLDSFAYNAHTTALDALWMGLPVLTRKGNTPASSLCAAVLGQLALDELISDSTEGYIASAVALAGDREALRAIGGRLMRARTASRVFDTAYKVRLYEQAYATMWARHVAGLPLADFEVPSLVAWSACESVG